MTSALTLQFIDRIDQLAFLKSQGFTSFSHRKGGNRQMDAGLRGPPPWPGARWSGLAWVLAITLNLAPIKKSD